MKVFALIVLSVFVSGCPFNKKLVDVEVYKKMPPKERARYYNGLSKTQKIDYFGTISKDAVYLYPPNDFYLFKNDGSIHHEDSIGGAKTYGTIGFWKIENGKLIVTASSANPNMKNIFGAELFTIEDISADALNSDPPVVGYDLGPGKITLVSSD
jgi:hypothetical protein